MIDTLADEAPDDDFLRNALLLANSPQVMGLDGEAPASSPRFQRRMDRLLAAPFRRAKWAQRRPGAGGLRRVAAVAALVLSASLFVAALQFNARAFFQNVVIDWNTHSVAFVFQGTAEGELGRWEPGYLPEGFEQTDATEFVGTWNITYQNKNGDTISLDYTLIEQGTSFNLDSEHSDHEQISINGRLAELFRSNTPGWPSFVVWTDQKGTTVFLLLSEIDPDELVAIAKSITKIK